MTSTTTVTLGGTGTVLHTWGPETGPVVVLLHSAGLDGSSLDLVARELAAAGRRVVAPDLRGHGRSTAVPSQVTLTAMAADVVELASTLGGSRPRLVGTSMGGVVAGLAARLSPEAWSDLTVVCSPDRGYPAFTERATAVADGGMAAHVEPTVTRWFTTAQLAQQHPAVEACRRAVAAMDPSCWDAVWRDFATFEGWPDLRDVLPVRGVAGAEDASTPPEVVRRLLQRAGGHLDVVAEAPHQLLMTHPREAAALILA